MVSQRIESPLSGPMSQNSLGQTRDKIGSSLGTAHFQTLPKRSPAETPPTGRILDEELRIMTFDKGFNDIEGMWTSGCTL